MLLIVMGVTGSGKTTVGRALGDRLGLPFYDADDYHSAANRAKMARGERLTDADREPWLARLAGLSATWQKEGGAVLACSALKRAYRARLVAQITQHRFIYLELAPEIAALRLEARRGHHDFIADYA